MMVYPAGQLTRPTKVTTSGEGTVHTAQVTSLLSRLKSWVRPNPLVR